MYVVSGPAKADAGVAGVGEELYGRRDRCAVVDDDRVGAGHQAVDGDDGYVAITRGVQERGVVVDRYDDDPVDHLPDEEAHHLGLGFGVLARVADDRPVAGLAQTFLDAGDDGRVERGVKLVEDDPDGHGAAAPQVARDVVDLIVEFGRGLLDELAVGAKNVAPVVVLGDRRE